MKNLNDTFFMEFWERSTWDKHYHMVSSKKSSELFDMLTIYIESNVSHHVHRSIDRKVKRLCKI